jgi:hypothetical protein
MISDQRQPQSAPPALALPEIPVKYCLMIMAAVTVGIFWEVLVLRPDEFLSDPRMDLRYFFFHWRSFGFHELRSGNLPLWNPHFASGAPFLGNFQSALLYPLNALYLVLPLAAATNWTIALHVFLGGAFVFFWMRHRGLHSLACLLAGLMFMFCGPHFLQVHAGHLPNLCTLIWAPLLFLAIDQMMDRPALGAALLGTFATAMSVFAGHPQFVYYMGVGAAFYSGFQLLCARQRGKTILGLAAIALGGMALSAVQLFTGMQESADSMRSLGMSYEFASSFSFPPENFLTVLMPWFFGNMKEVDLPYWGRWFLTENSLFVSVMGFVLALYGGLLGKAKVRRYSRIMLIITVWLALGGYTPVFHLLYNYVPGFNEFRGMDKFLWLTALFLCALAAVGLDKLLRGGTAPRWLTLGVVGLGVVLVVLALLPGQLGWWVRVVRFVPGTGAFTLLFSDYANPNFIALSSRNAIRCLLHGAMVLFAAASLLNLANSRRLLACLGILMLATAELVGFAETSLVTFAYTPVYSAPVLDYLAQHPGDYRLIHYNPNAAMTAGTRDLQNDDPSGLLRYARFVAFAEGYDLDTSPFGTPGRNLDTNAFRMLRLRYCFSLDEKDCLVTTNGLPQLQLVNRFRVMTNYHEIFSTLTNRDFNMEQEVILERPPDPIPQPAATNGSVRLLDSSTDFLDIEADVGTPTVLLITDAYSSGWRALPLPGSAQSHYDVMPANYCLRAVPLAAGHHRFRVEYSPSAYRIGKVISLSALGVFLALSALVVVNQPAKATAPQGRP